MKYYLVSAHKLMNIADYGWNRPPEEYDDHYCEGCAEDAAEIAERYNLGEVLEIHARTMLAVDGKPLIGRDS